MGVNIKNITKKYDDFVAVDKATLDIKRGEFFTLLGPSGCGKTTLLRMIAGFNEITSGDIIISGNKINDTPAHKRNIGMVFQNYAIFPHMSVFENVVYGLKARKVSKIKIKERVLNALDMVEMRDQATKEPSELSGGQQQRVALARAIVIHPEILLMDEPLSNLDAKLRVKMRATIKKLQTSLNITTIYVTHDQEEALAVSDRIAVMHKGTVQQIGTPEEIYSFPVNAFVANFIGTSNFIYDAALTGDSTKLLSVRPEDILIVDIDSGTINGEVTLTTFLGECVSYEIKLENSEKIEVKVFSKDIKIKQIGDKVGIFFPEDKRKHFNKSEES
ncbi:ABC transporter ATP-binding protein [Psychrilyobacter sp.]|uniref:ABC transporter ATP-binding protein n=1 Tax=Psychrilyobacter sp. TaxID=2586924 RepID=UPI003017180E